MTLPGTLNFVNSSEMVEPFEKISCYHSTSWCECDFVQHASMVSKVSKGNVKGSCYGRVTETWLLINWHICITKNDSSFITNLNVDFTTLQARAHWKTSFNGNSGRFLEKIKVVEQLFWSCMWNLIQVLNWSGDAVTYCHRWHYHKFVCSCTLSIMPTLESSDKCS